ncbi:MAG: hypothetical protein ACFB20_11365 [Opitutales bacterium]
MTAYPDRPSLGHDGPCYVATPCSVRFSGYFIHREITELPTLAPLQFQLATASVSAGGLESQFTLARSPYLGGGADRSPAVSPLENPSPRAEANAPMHMDYQPYAFFVSGEPLHVSGALAANDDVVITASTPTTFDTEVLYDSGLTGPAYGFNDSERVGHQPLQQRPTFRQTARVQYERLMDFDSIDFGGNDSILDIGDRAELMNPLYSYYHASASGTVREWSTYVFVNTVLVQGLKELLGVPRIDGGSDDSMPSGHSAAAGLGAFYIAESYGYNNAYEPLGVAAVTGMSRTLVRKANPEEWWLGNDFNRRDPAHRPQEVFAGLGIAFITSKLLVESGKRTPKNLDASQDVNGLKIIPVPYEDSVGLMIYPPGMTHVSLMPYLGSSDGGFVVNIPWGTAATNPIFRN